MRVQVSPAAPRKIRLRLITWLAAMQYFINNRGVAQLVARSVRDAEAVGSNPTSPTNKKPP